MKTLRNSQYCHTGNKCKLTNENSQNLPVLSHRYLRSHLGAWEISAGLFLVVMVTGTCVHWAAVGCSPELIKGDKVI